MGGGGEAGRNWQIHTQPKTSATWGAQEGDLSCGPGAVGAIPNAATQGWVPRELGPAGTFQEPGLAAGTDLSWVSKCTLGPRTENPVTLHLRPRPPEALPSTSPAHLPCHVYDPAYTPTWVSTAVLGEWAKGRPEIPQEDPAEGVV